MEVARYRHDNSDSPNYNKNQWYTDIQRTQMQQQILVNLAKKVLSWDSLTKINGFVEIFNEYVDTDLSLTDMLYFASQWPSIWTPAPGGDLYPGGGRQCHLPGHPLLL